MSEAVLAVPLSRLFGQPAPPARPSEAELHQRAVAAAFEAGRAAGEAALRPRIAELDATVEALRARTSRELEAGARLSASVIAALDAALAEAVASLSLAVARQVLAAEPAIRQETLNVLVAEALAGLPQGASGVLRMNPEDAALAPRLPSGWALVADPDLSPGDVIAERGSSLSATGLTLRLDQVHTALENGL